MTELKQLLIETPIDLLIDIVRRRHSLTIEEAAVILKVSEEQVEEWVKILEDHGYLKLVYPPIGKPRIVAVEIPEYKLEKKASEFEKRKAKVEEVAQRFSQKVIETEKGVEISHEKFQILEKELHQKLSTLGEKLAKLNELEKMKLEVLKESEEIKDISEKVGKEIENITSLATGAEDEINKEIEKLETHESQIKNLEQERKKIQNEISALDKEMKIVESLAPKPAPVFKLPTLEVPRMFGLKKMMKKHKKKTEKIKVRKKELQEKVMKVKERISPYKKLTKILYFKKPKRKVKIIKIKPKRKVKHRKR